VSHSSGAQRHDAVRGHPFAGLVTVAVPRVVLVHARAGLILRVLEEGLAADLDSAASHISCR
jgi:hypothetical protein